MATARTATFSRRIDHSVKEALRVLASREGAPQYRKHDRNDNPGLLQAYRRVLR